MCEAHPTCTRHAGPHWLYQDMLDRVQNLRYVNEELQKALDSNRPDIAEVGLIAFAQEEAVRLRNKVPHLKGDFPLGYKELGMSRSGETFHEEVLRLQDVYAALLTEIQEKVKA